MTGDELIALAHGLEPLLEPRPPAEEAALAAAEALLGFGFPSELRAFLACTDGATIAIRLDSGEVIPGALPLVWDLVDIVVQNTSGPELAPIRPTDLLWFATAGVDGITIGHAMDASGTPTDEVVLWYPIDGELTPFASSFRRVPGALAARGDYLITTSGPQCRVLLADSLRLRRQLTAKDP